MKTKGRDSKIAKLIQLTPEYTEKSLSIPVNCMLLVYQKHAFHLLFEI